MALPHKLKEKLEDILNSNPNFECLCRIDNFINGTSELMPETICDIKKKVTSVNVERTFTTYKNILMIEHTTRSLSSQ